LREDFSGIIFIEISMLF